MSTPEILAAAQALVDELEGLGVGYFIGGSVASSAHGMPRSTLDVDLVADLRLEHARPLAERLQTAFYVDEDMIRSAVARGASFNVIHLATMVKLDVFVLKSTSYDQAAFSRAQEGAAVLDEAAGALRLATPEDVVLHKLYSYEAGDQGSERQWHDVIGVLKVQGSTMDLASLRRWAAELKVLPLLDRALREVGLAPDA